MNTMPAAMSAAIRLITELRHAPNARGCVHPNIRIAMHLDQYDECFKFLQGTADWPGPHLGRSFWSITIMGVPIVADEDAPLLD